ncbi:unnamed protein product [Closterium sp. NIES-54]
MASTRVPRFDAEGRVLEFPNQLLRTELYLQSQRQDGDTLWAHASCDLPSPPSLADLLPEPTDANREFFAQARIALSVWQSRDAARRIGLGSLLPETEEAHFS